MLTNKQTEKHGQAKTTSLAKAIISREVLEDAETGYKMFGLQTVSDGVTNKLANENTDTKSRPLKTKLLHSHPISLFTSKQQQLRN